MMKARRLLACLLLVAMIASLGFTTAFAEYEDGSTTEEAVETESAQESEETAEPEVVEATEPEVTETAELEVTETTEPKVTETTEPEVTETAEPEVTPEPTPEPVVNAITAQPEDASAVSGGEAEFTVGVSGEVDYVQWQYSRNGRSWSNLSAWRYGTDTTLVYPASRSYNGYQFRAVVYFADGAKETSDAAKLSVTSPYINSQPASVTVAPGETAQFTVGVEGNVSYVRWQMSKNGGRTWSNLSTWTYGSDVTLSYPAEEAYDGYLFRAYVVCWDGTRLTSEAAMLTVAEPEPEPEEGIFSQELDTVTVAVEYSAEAGVPENAELVVGETDNDSDASAAAAKRNAKLADVLFEEYGNVLINDVRYLDIGLEADGEPFEDLQAPVKVTITYNDALSTEDYDTGYPVQHIVVHYAEAGTEILIPEEIKDENGVVKQISFETTSFSVFDDVTVQAYDADAVPETYETNDVKTTELKPLGTGKTLTYNKDGTYTLALSVTGDSQSESSTTTQSVNVVFVFDVSNSMINNYAVSTYGSYGGTDGSNGYAGDYYQLYKYENGRYSAITDSENYSGTVYRYQNFGYSVYNGKRYLHATRASASEYAVYNMAKAIQDTYIDFAFVYFSDSSNSGHRTFSSTNWTKNPSTDFADFLDTTGTTYLQQSSAYTLQYHSGTNWQAGLAEALDPVLKSADSDPTYVIFITDGAPNNGQGVDAYNSYVAAQANARAVETYQTSSHTSVSSDDNTTMYAIYAYGTEADYLDDLTYYALNGSARTAGTGTDTTGVSDRYFNASNTETLNNAIKSITNSIKNSLDYGGVSFEDGIATDTTNTTLSTTVDGEVTGLTYTVSNGTNTAYTVTTNGSTVTFHINGTDYTGTKGTYHFEKDDTDYEYYFATVGTGDDAVVYKMALADLSDGTIDWDLTGIGGLIGGYTYTLSFTVWPVQIAYDIAADLNNGLETYSWDTTLDTYKSADETGKGYAIGGIDGYPNIVKYENGTYAVLTNTEQEVTYYVVNTKEVDGVPTTTYDGPYTTNPTAPAPMALVGSSIDLVKEWLVSLEPSELEDWVKAGNTLTLRVTVDSNKYIDFTFPSTDSIVKDEDNNITGLQDSETMTIQSDDGNVTWKESCAIAPGIMLERDLAAAEGIITKTTDAETGDVNYNYGSYKTVTIGSDIYVVLSEGHDYTVQEVDGSDLHFEFSTQTYHPMLVNGTLQNISFVMSADGKIVDKSTADVTNPNLTAIKGTNTLKGGIDILKNVYGSDWKDKDAKRIEDCDDEFAFTVELWQLDEDNDSIPVYATAEEIAKDQGGVLGWRVYDLTTGDEIKRGNIAAGVANVEIGEDVTTVTLTMQANQYIYIANVVSGTHYKITEIQDEAGAYNHFKTERYITDTWDDERWEEAEESPIVVDGDDTALSNHSITGEVKGNRADIVRFSNWSSFFYVYHSSNNEVEKISFADERVKGKYVTTTTSTTDEETGETTTTTTSSYVYSFNIVEETGRDSSGTATSMTAIDSISGYTSYGLADGGQYLYGGYFTDYGAKGVSIEQINETATDALIYTEVKKTVDGEEVSNGFWSSDDEAKAYTLANASEVINTGKWTRGNVKTVSGDAAEIPGSGAVLFLKEVPIDYLTPYINFVYETETENHKILDLALITAIDDTCYRSAGYTINNYYTGVISSKFRVVGYVEDTYTVSNINSKLTKGYLATVQGTKLTNILSYTGTNSEGSATSSGTAMDIDWSNSAGFRECTIIPTWRTLDNILVTGTPREIKVGENGYLSTVTFDGMAPDFTKS